MEKELIDAFFNMSSNKVMYIRDHRSYEELHINNSRFKHFAFKAIYITSSLLLQMPSKASKWEDHFRGLEGRIDPCKFGKIDELLFDGKIIQQRLKITNTSTSIGILSNKFVFIMEKGNANRSLNY